MEASTQSTQLERASTPTPDGPTLDSAKEAEENSLTTSQTQVSREKTKKETVESSKPRVNSAPAILTSTPNTKKALLTSTKPKGFKKKEEPAPLQLTRGAVLSSILFDMEAVQKVQETRLREKTRQPFEKIRAAIVKSSGGEEAAMKAEKEGRRANFDTAIAFHVGYAERVLVLGAMERERMDEEEIPRKKEEEQRKEKDEELKRKKEETRERKELSRRYKLKNALSNLGGKSSEEKSEVD